MLLAILLQPPTILHHLLTRMAVSESGIHSLLAHEPASSARHEAGTTWHNIISFSPAQNNYLRSLQKGAQVYVEANFELRDADPAADPSSPQGQRQIFLRHGMLLCFTSTLHDLTMLQNPSESSGSPPNTIASRPCVHVIVWPLLPLFIGRIYCTTPLPLR